MIYSTGIMLFRKKKEVDTGRPTIRQLLGLDPLKVGNATTRAMMTTGLNTEIAPLVTEFHKMNTSSRVSDGAAFLEELDGLALTEESPLIFLRSARGDAAWDIGLKVLIPGNEGSQCVWKPLFILINAKSTSETHKETHKEHSQESQVPNTQVPQDLRFIHRNVFSKFFLFNLF